jgi:hypothetical protein
MPHRRIALLAVLPLALLALGWTALWYYVAGTARARFLEWSDAKRAEGYTVAYESLAVSGYPLRLRVHFDHPQLAKGSQFAWRADRLIATLEPWHWRSIRLESPGEHHLVLDDRRQAFHATSASTTGAIRFGTDWGVGALQTAFRAVEIGQDGQPEAISISALDLGAYIPIGATSGDPSVVFVVSAEHIVAPFPGGTVLAPSIEKVGLDIDVWGRPLGSPLKEAIEAWRDQGGTIDLKVVLLRWGPLFIEGDGTLALDRDLQPVGALSARVSGYSESLDALVGAGLLRPTAAAAATTVLNLISKTPAEGEPSEAKIPITIQDRHFYVGPVGFFEIPPIRWE